MTKNKGLQTADQLIRRAKKGEHSEFEYIRSLDEYFAAKTVKNVLKKVVKSFLVSKNNLYNSYTRAVKAGTNDLNVILALSELIQVINFYKAEIEIISEMIYEYIAYVHCGHFIDTILGRYRKEEEQIP